MSKTLRDLMPKIVCEGKEIAFREFLRGQGGSGELYNHDEYESILEAALSKKVNWGDVEDVLCPVADEILIEAAEEDLDVYYDLVTAFKTAYNKLKTKHIIENRSILEAIILVCEEHAKTYDLNLDPQERKALINSQRQMTYSFYDRLHKEEKNIPTLKEINSKLGGALCWNEMYRSFLKAKGLEKEFDKFHKEKNPFDVIEAYS